MLLQHTIQRRDAAVFLPLQATQEALGISRYQSVESNAIVGHALTGLSRLGLIESGWAVGDELNLRSIAPLIPEDAPHGIVASPGAFGIELMLAVHGHGNFGVNSFLDPSIEFTMQAHLPPVPGTLGARLPPTKR